MIDSKSAFISPQSFVSAKLFPVDRRQLYLCGVLFTPDDHLVVSTGNELLVNDPTATDILEKVLIINGCFDEYRVLQHDITPENIIGYFDPFAIPQQCHIIG